MTHESVNKFGIAALPEKRRFDYLVSIQTSPAGLLSVSEYRNGGGTESQFPDGIATNGLPALVLIFHPYYATNYDMVCEGLARTSRGLAWQIHFRQLPDKTNGIKSYQFGMNGPNYEVKLKGRAWISADNYGITPLMDAANLGDIAVVRYLIDKGADLSAHDLGKKNDGSFGSSVEPLMPIDYAIGVGTFVPNNAVIMHTDVVKLMSEVMKQRGIVHTTSECTLRGFTCSQANVDPKTATPAEIAKIRKIQIGYQVDGITGGLGVAEKDGEKK